MGRFSPTVTPSSVDPLAVALDRLQEGFGRSYGAARDRRRQGEADAMAREDRDAAQEDRQIARWRSGVREGDARLAALGELAVPSIESVGVTPSAPGLERTPEGINAQDLPASPAAGEPMVQSFDALRTQGWPGRPPLPGSFVNGRGFHGITPSKPDLQRFEQIRPDTATRPGEYMDWERTPESRAVAARAAEEERAGARRRGEFDYELGARRRVSQEDAARERTRREAAYRAAGMSPADAKLAAENPAVADDIRRGPSESWSIQPDDAGYLYRVNTKTGETVPVQSPGGKHMRRTDPVATDARRDEARDADRRDATILRRAQELTRGRGKFGDPDYRRPVPYEQAVEQAGREIDAVMGVRAPSATAGRPTLTRKEQSVVSRTVQAIKSKSATIADAEEAFGSTPHVLAAIRAQVGVAPK